MYDDEAYLSKLETASWIYICFQPAPSCLSLYTLWFPWDKKTNYQYTLWALAKATGRLPLPAVGFDTFPRFLDACPFCSKLQANLEHILMRCVHSSRERSSLRAPRESWHSFAVFIFGGSFMPDDEYGLDPRTIFVADCTLQTAAKIELSRIEGEDAI